MRGTTLEVAMPADVSGAYSAISSDNLGMYSTLIGQHVDNGAALEPWRSLFEVDYELRCQFTMLCTFFNRRYISNVYKPTLITMHELKP